MTKGWLPISTCPAAEDSVSVRRIIVWHVYQGTMVYDAASVRNNRFLTAWHEEMETWIDPAERLPTKADADPEGCVLAYNSYGQLCVMGWHRIQSDEDARKWAPCPPPPADAARWRTEERSGA